MPSRKKPPAAQPAPDPPPPDPGATLPQYATKADLAGIIGATRQKLQFHSRKPGFPRPDGAGRYQVVDVLAYARRAGILARNPGPVAGAGGAGASGGSAAARQTDGAAAPSPPGEEVEIVDLNYERALLAREMRRQKEIENGKLRDQLLQASAVDQAWELIRSSVRQRILALPAKIESQSHLDPEARAKLRKLLDREVDDVLTELAKPPDYQLAATADGGVEGEAPDEPT